MSAVGFSLITPEFALSSVIYVLLSPHFSSLQQSAPKNTLRNINRKINQISRTTRMLAEYVKVNDNLKSLSLINVLKSETTEFIDILENSNIYNFVKAEKIATKYINSFANANAATYIQNKLADMAKKFGNPAILYIKVAIANKLINSLESLILSKSTVATKKDQDVVTFFVRYPENCEGIVVNLLSIFRKFFEYRMPTIPISHRINHDEIITLSLVFPRKKKHRIESELMNYGLILSGEAKVEDLITDKIHIEDLEYRLKNTTLELEHQRQLRLKEEEISTILKEHHAGRTNEIENLHNNIGELIKHVSSANDSLKLLIQFANGRSKQLLLMLSLKLNEGLSESDKGEVTHIFKEIQKEDPSLLNKINELLLEGAISGAAGNYLFQWLQALSSIGL